MAIIQFLPISFILNYYKIKNMMNNINRIGESFENNTSFSDEF